MNQFHDFLPGSFTPRNTFMHLELKPHQVSIWFREPVARLGSQNFRELFNACIVVERGSITNQ